MYRPRPLLQFDGNLNKFKSVVSKSEVRLNSEVRREPGPEDGSDSTLREARDDLA